MPGKMVLLCRTFTQEYLIKDRLRLFRSCLLIYAVLSTNLYTQKSRCVNFEKYGKENLILRVIISNLVLISC